MSILVQVSLCHTSKVKEKNTRRLMPLLMMILKQLKKGRICKYTFMYLVSYTCIMIWPAITLVFAYVHYHDKYNS